MLIHADVATPLTPQGHVEKGSKGGANKKEAVTADKEEEPLTEVNYRV